MSGTVPGDGDIPPARTPGSRYAAYPSSGGADALRATPHAPHPVLPPDRMSRLSGILLGLTFTLIIIASVLSFVRLPYVVLSPGPATNTLGRIDGKPVIEVSGATTYPAKGSLDFTTVRVNGGPGMTVTVYDLLGAWLSGDEEVLPEKEVFPPEQTEKQADEESAAQMSSSEETAAAVALRHLGHAVPVEIVEVRTGSPAAGLLKVGDRIVSIDGKPMPDSLSVIVQTRSHKPGEPLTVVVDRDGTRVTQRFRTVDDGHGGSVIRVALGHAMPFSVKVNAGKVGGPSAGMMFTLAIYDVLTPGDLTGGKAIAGTGVILDDGSVFPIGGIAQKLAGARTAGAQWFLAPADNCDEVVGHVPEGLRVVKVSTIEESLAAVRAIAADRAAGLPTCVAGAAARPSR